MHLVSSREGSAEFATSTFLSLLMIIARVDASVESTGGRSARLLRTSGQILWTSGQNRIPIRDEQVRTRIPSYTRC